MMEEVSQYELLNRIWNLLPTGVASGISYWDGGRVPLEGYAVPLENGKVKCEVEWLGEMTLEPQQFNDRCYITNVRLRG